jgi:hypothetical protein
MTGGSRTVVKRSRDAALDHVKKALGSKGNPLKRLEVDFIRTSCHILGINGETTMRVIVKKAKEKGEGQPRRVLASLRSQLEELGARVEKHNIRGPLQPLPSTHGHLTAWVHQRAAWHTCRAVRTG